MSLKKLQEKIGLAPAQQDGAFGPTTLKAAAKYYSMSPERAAHFFGQTSHETGGFTILSENLHYNADGLKKIFPSYFPGNMADLYKMQPEKIASRVYGSRMGNGDEASKEGWTFRGRGALQLTGKDNYKAFSEYLHKPEILTNPDLVATDFAFESALFFFDKNKLWAICDQGINEASILALTKRINGGTHGLDDRKAKTLKYYEYLKS